MPSAPRKIWDIPGGIHPADNKAQSLELELGTLPLPEQLIVPLNQHSGAPATALVKAGDTVLKGQKIAAASSVISASVHAPTSGTVVAIEQRPVPHPSGMSALSIVIDVDGKEQWVARQGTTDFRNTSPQQLLEQIREAGIAGLGGAGFPASVKLSAGNISDRPGDGNIHTLIINASECEPYITADDMLMRIYPEQVVEGIKILAHILGQPHSGQPLQILIGIEDNKTQAYDAIEPYLKGTNIELVEFPTKYPSGGEKQLIQILTGEELPNGKLPADKGIICQNVGTTHAIYRAIVEGSPLISRITTVTGNTCGTKRNFELLIGTPIDYVLQQCGYTPENNQPVVMGGPMMGFALPDTAAPMIKTTNCILAPSNSEMPPPPPAQACIRCGMCAEVCPASLLPQQLFWYAQSRNHQRLQAHNLFDCIECGACAYVCPSHIPLVQSYRAAKSDMRHAALEKVKSDRARERFEYNKLRKQQAEAEKAAKREARRLAAEQAKATLTADNKSSAANDVVQAALQKVAAKQVSPEQQKAKLQRSVSSAENRLQRLQNKLSDGQSADAEAPLSEEQVAGYQAQIENARLKLSEAQQKLDDFKPTQDNPAADITDKVKAKVLDSPQQTLEKKVSSLQQRLANIETKLADCDDDSLRQALTNSAHKFEAKLQDALNELKNTTDNTPVTDSATIAATERALNTASTKQQLSAEQQLQTDIDRLQQRIAKAEQKMADLTDTSQTEALTASIATLKQKLANAMAQLENTQP